LILESTFSINNNGIVSASDSQLVNSLDKHHPLIIEYVRDLTEKIKELQEENKKLEEKLINTKKLSPEIIRYSVNRIKALANTAIPAYEQPADSHIEDAVRDILKQQLTT
jgi:F0F1-type ATP synthase membrane subunit b/b'